MNQLQLNNFARAVCEAKDAYQSYKGTGRGAGVTNRETLEYKRLKRAGEVLSEIGGYPAMIAAVNGFYDDPKLSAEAGDLINGIWDGIGTWAS